MGGESNEAAQISLGAVAGQGKLFHFKYLFDREKW